MSEDAVFTHTHCKHRQQAIDMASHSFSQQGVMLKHAEQA